MDSDRIYEEIKRARMSRKKNEDEYDFGKMKAGIKVGKEFFKHITETGEEELKREIDKLEDNNEHGMVALKLAQSFGTPKEVKTVQDINKRHQRAGSIEHKDQKERDAIIRKYYRRMI